MKPPEHMVNAVAVHGGEALKVATEIFNEIWCEIENSADGRVDSEAFRLQLARAISDEANSNTSDAAALKSAALRRLSWAIRSSASTCPQKHRRHAHRARM